MDAAKATRREWLGLLVIALPCLLYSMDLTVLNLALPTLSASLRPSATQLLWIIDVYGFLVAGSLITMGTLGDHIGRRKLLLIGAAAFGATSVLAAFASSVATLIAARALLGLAGATLAPSTLSLIRTMFRDPGQRTLAIGIWITSFSVGAALGPVLGGLVLAHFWPGAVFLIGVPAMLLLLVTGPRLLPEFRDPDAGPLDFVSAGLSLLAVLSLVFGVKQCAEHGPTLWALGGVALGLGVSAQFVKRQARLPRPLLDLSLFERPAFSASLAAYALGCFVGFGVFVLIAQYLQLVLGLSAQAAGFWTVPFALAFIVGSMVTPVLSKIVPARVLLPAGLLLAACGFLLLTRLGGDHALFKVVTGLVVYSLGLSPVFTLATDLVVGSAPNERAGAAAALSETGSELGGALGVAILGSLAGVVYRSALVQHAPIGVPADALAAAQSTLAAGLAAAARLPAGGELADAARAAFTHCLELTASVAAAIALVLAAVTARALRQAPQREGSETGCGSIGPEIVACDRAPSSRR